MKIDKSYEMAKSLKSLMTAETIDSENSLRRIRDVILKADLQNRIQNKEFIPVYLLVNCRICSTFNDIITTRDGYICLNCQSAIDEQARLKELPKTKCYLTIFDAGAIPIKKYGQINIPSHGDQLDIAALGDLYTKIAKNAGYNHWMMDPKGDVIGGYYYKDGGERLVISKTEVTVKPKQNSKDLKRPTLQLN